MLSTILVILITVLSCIFWLCIAVAVSLYCGFRFIQTIQVAQRWWKENRR